MHSTNRVPRRSSRFPSLGCSIGFDWRRENVWAASGAVLIENRAFPVRRKRVRERSDLAIGQMLRLARAVRKDNGSYFGPTFRKPFIQSLDMAPTAHAEGTAERVCQKQMILGQARPCPC